MISRYTLPEMAALWSEEEKFRRWLKLELLACEAWATEGAIPKATLAVITSAPLRINRDRIQAIESEVRHDVIAFLTSITEQLGPEGRFLHLGLTSSDVVDSVFATQLTDALDRLAERVGAIQNILHTQIETYRDTVMIGRSHGIHAEPTTFGLKLALWYAAFDRHAARLREVRPRIAVGKLSGAVGTYAHLPPAVEAYVLGKLGLTAEPVATQIVQRDRHAEFFSVLAVIAGTVEQIAVEIRHLQRTEVLEVAEPFGKGQKGSSAMPHKRNPILCENLTGCARMIRSYAGAALENVALWHERDISHSSVERVIGPDATILLDFMLHRLAGVLEGLQVFPQRMAKNLDATRGLIFSQQLLLALIESGMTREDAYACVQQHAMRAWESAEDFRALVGSDPHITARLNAEQLAAVFDPQRHLQHVNEIIDRVFAQQGALS